jgi:hypothetical protein
MWKMLVGFIVFAVVAVYLLMKSGADIDMGGEKHGADAVHAEEAKTSEAAPAVVAPSAPVEAASVAASAASN